jgi:topoisomerase IV subunit A
MLRLSVDNTKELLRQELLIKKSELEEQWHSLSLEKWFIEKRIYKEKQYENAKSTDEALDFILTKAVEHKLQLVREINRDDLLKLLEIKMKRILRFNSDKAEEDLLAILDEIKEVQRHLDTLVEYTINYYKRIKEKFGKGRERKTEIRNFDTIDTAQVAVANEKLYVNYKEGFVGYGIKKDEYVCDCSDIDEIVVLRKDGKFMVSKVSEKAFFGKDIIYVNVFKRQDKRTIYNVVYRDGRTSVSYIKRFAVTGITRDKEYDLTKGQEGSKVIYFTANPNGEAEVIKVFLKPKPKVRKLVFEEDFKNIAIKGRDAQGNILTKNDIHKINLKEEGVSTLGGRKIWFDEEVFRLNADERGKYIGEFVGDDRIVVITKDGNCRLTNFDLSNHYEDNIAIIQKYNPETVFSAIHFDAEQGFYYLKRFQIEDFVKEQSFIAEVQGSFLVDVVDDEFPQVKIVFGGKHESREAELIDAEEFIAIKGLKARGKRLTTFEVGIVSFDEPIEKESSSSYDDEDPDDDSNGEDLENNQVEPDEIDMDNEQAKSIDDIPFEIVNENSSDDIEFEIIIPDEEEESVPDKKEKPKKDKKSKNETKDDKKPPEGGIQMTLGF